MANQRILSTHGHRIHGGSGGGDVDADAQALARGRPNSVIPVPLAGRLRASSLALGGAMLTAFAAIVVTANVDWGPLSRWQARTDYQIATGLLLGAYLAAQWLLALARVLRRGRVVRAALGAHHLGGLIGPLLWLAHSTRLGAGYLAGLSGLFFFATVLGLANPAAVPAIRTRSGIWIVTHTATAVTLVAVAGYHAWTALYFE